MGVEVMGARGGFGGLATAMADALTGRGVDIRTASPVRALEPVEDPGGAVGAGGAGAVRVVTDTGPEDHDAVVVALSPRPASRLLPSHLLPSVPFLAGIPVRSTACLVLATRDPLRTGWFGLSVPRTEPGGETLAAVCVQGEKGGGVVGGEGGALTLVPAPGVGERWAGSEPRAVVAEALPALRTVMPDGLPQILEARLVRLEDSVWVPVPGHFERVAALDPDALPPWLGLAGDYLVAPTVEGAVRSGLAAADRLGLNGRRG
jgi:protoporphyrinogen/coproporphyrinogen III oxidase